MFFFYWDGVSCSPPGWPQTTEFYVAVLQVLGLQMSATMPGSQTNFFSVLILFYFFHKESDIGIKENGKNVCMY